MEEISDQEDPPRAQSLPSTSSRRKSSWSVLVFWTSLVDLFAPKGSTHTSPHIFPLTHPILSKVNQLVGPLVEDPPFACSRFDRSVRQHHQLTRYVLKQTP